MSGLEQIYECQRCGFRCREYRRKCPKCEGLLVKKVIVDAVF